MDEIEGRIANFFSDENTSVLVMSTASVAKLIFAGKNVLYSKISTEGGTLGGISLIFPFESISEGIILARGNGMGMDFYLKDGFSDEYSFDFSVSGGIILKKDTMNLSFIVKRTDNLVVDIAIDPGFKIFFNQSVDWFDFIEESGMSFFDENILFPTTGIRGKMSDAMVDVDFLGDFSLDKSEISLIKKENYNILSAKLFNPETKRGNRFIQRGETLEMGISIKFNR
ncbi:MAG: hypothetical protein ACWGHO_00905 [Candidatus Moraniibacteriota bacterium]